MSRWCWSPYRDMDGSEVFASRELAEEHGRTEGRKYYGPEGDEFGWVAPVEEIDKDRYASAATDAVALVEHMDEQGDVGCAFDEPVFELLDGAQEALEALLVMWAARYVTHGGKYLIGAGQRVEPLQPEEVPPEEEAQPSQTSEPEPSDQGGAA